MRKQRISDILHTLGIQRAKLETRIVIRDNHIQDIKRGMPLAAATIENLRRDLKGERDRAESAERRLARANESAPRIVQQESRPPLRVIREQKAEQFCAAKDKMLAAFEADYFRSLAVQCNWSIAAMARTCGLHRAHVRKYLRRYSIYDTVREEQGRNNAEKPTAPVLTAITG